MKKPLPEVQWYCVHTLAAHEATAARNLVRAGYWVWYPFERVRMPSVRAKGVHKEVERPYFSRYIFVALRFIGVGEGIDDLQAFSAHEFVAALFDSP